MTNDILIITATSESEGLPEKREKESGQLFPKAKLTGLTFRTLQNNIKAGRLENMALSLNRELLEIKNAITQAATLDAEEELRKQILNESAAEARKKEEQDREQAALRFEEALSKASSPQVIQTVLNGNALEFTNVNDVFYNGERLVASTIPGMQPKALMAPIFLVKLCSAIDRKRELYKYAQTVQIPPQSKQIANMPPKVANWRTLFESNLPLEKVFDVDETRDSEEKKIVETSMVDYDKTLSKEDFQTRKMIADIGDELARIRELRQGIGGSTPFNSGLVERTSYLLDMLSNLVGITINVSDIDKSMISDKRTDFQKFIDDVIGYKSPSTPEEHMRKEEEMEKHYSDPEVQQTIDDLRLKSILFDMNEPESAALIDAAERKHNDQLAENALVLDTLDSSEPTVVENIIVNQTPSVNSDVDDERLQISEMALNEARHIIEVNQKEQEKEKIRRMAEVEAKRIFVAEEQRKEAETLHKMGEAEARRIIEANQKEQEKEKIRRMAEVEAKRIFAAEEQRKEVEELHKMGETEARRIIEANQKEQEKEKIRRMAEVEAKRIFAAEGQRKETEELHRMAEAEAKHIFEVLKAKEDEEREFKAIKTAALEQAHVLFEQSKNNDGFEVSGQSIGRYGIYSSPSKPIRINPIQLQRIRDKGQNELETSNSKEILVSLRNQLDQLDLGRDDDLDMPHMMSKALS